VDQAAQVQQTMALVLLELQAKAVQAGMVLLPMAVAVAVAAVGRLLSALVAPLQATEAQERRQALLGQALLAAAVAAAVATEPAAIRAVVAQVAQVAVEMGGSRLLRHTAQTVEDKMLRQILAAVVDQAVGLFWLLILVAAATAAQALSSSNTPTYTQQHSPLA
jgi:hypothetical protein